MDSLAPPPPLAFPDFQAGASYLSRLPLANPASAEEQINQFLDSLLAAPPDQDDYLELLDELWAPLAFVEEEMAKRYHSKPLVLGEIEEKGFQRVLKTWRKLGRAYSSCLDRDGAPPGNPYDACRMATVLYRCLQCTGTIMLEHYRARRELPPGLWLEFHGYYQAAEENRLALLPVGDDVDGSHGPAHCMAMYVTFLLMDTASPYSQSVRDINLIRRWAALWAPLVTVHRLEEGGRRPSHVLELGKDTGLHPVPKDRPADALMRCLDTSRLARQVSETVGQLRGKVSASRLGLGEEPSSYALRLLDQLLRPWSQCSAARKFRRFTASGQATVGVGFEAMHFFVSGRSFEQPHISKTYSRSEFNLMFSARGMTTPGQKLLIRAQDGYAADQWQVVNHSANGFRLARSSAGKKMSHGHLLAFCPPDGDKFLLAQVSWLMQEQKGGLVAGVAVLPGMPRAVAVRVHTGAMDNTAPFVQAFLLSPVPNMAEEGSMVLPLHTFQASRVFDLYADGFWQVRLKNVLQRGADFERVSFETV